MPRKRSCCIVPGPCGIRRACRSQRSNYGSSKDRKSTRLNSSHLVISYAVFCLKKKRDVAQIVVIFMMGRVIAGACEQKLCFDRSLIVNLLPSVLALVVERLVAFGASLRHTRL